MKADIEYLVSNNLAKPSYSPWSSPCLLAPKADNTPRFCTGYRKVNAVTVTDSFPMPQVEDCTDSISPASFITKVDLLKGYWQVPLTPIASEVCAFLTRPFYAVCRDVFWVKECACNLPVPHKTSVGGCTQL